MSTRNRPPFRAEHVGSLIRPPELLDGCYQGDRKPPQAKEYGKTGKMTDEELISLIEENITDSLGHGDD